MFVEGDRVRFVRHARPTGYVARWLGEAGVVTYVHDHYLGRAGNVRLNVRFDGTCGRHGCLWLKPGWVEREAK